MCLGNRLITALNMLMGKEVCTPLLVLPEHQKPSSKVQDQVTA